MDRKQVLDAARACVCGHREQDYGTPENNFARVAGLWEAYTGHEYSPEDVAVMLALLKVARIGSGRKHMDNYVDLAGYAALAGELAAEEDARRRAADDQLGEEGPRACYPGGCEACPIRSGCANDGKFPAPEAVAAAVAQVLADDVNKPRPAAGAAVAVADCEPDQPVDDRPGNMAETYGEIAGKAMEALHEALEASETAKPPAWMTEPRVPGAPCLDGLGACGAVETVTAQKLDGVAHEIRVSLDPAAVYPAATYPVTSKAVHIGKVGPLEAVEPLSRSLQRTARR